MDTLCERLVSFVPLAVGNGGLRLCSTEADCTRCVVDSRAAQSDNADTDEVDWTTALRVYEPCESLDMVDYVRALAKHYEIEDCQDAFYVCNLSDVVSQMERWRAGLPRVHPFYAVKCNDDRMLVGTLAALGACFDCASRAEIKRVLELGVSVERIIYANPCKQVSMLRYARAAHVPRMTFDNVDELRKIKTHYPEAGLLLRVLPEQVAVQCVLGNKFGATVEQAERLVREARALGLRVEGVCFHVGSGCRDAHGYALAVQRARRVWDMLLDAGFQPSVLDVGGGFPGSDEPGELRFEQICDSLNAALDEYFPPVPGFQIIAEPGRYFACRPFTLCCNVIAKRDCRDEAVARDEAGCESGAADQVQFMYYMNDGLYGSFNCLLYDHINPVPHYLRQSQEKAAASARFASILYGPTCDGADLILRNYAMPELQIGDWIYWQAMGAYTFAASSEFNGLPKPHMHYYLAASDLPLFAQTALPVAMPVLVPAALDSAALPAPAAVERAFNDLVQAVELQSELHQAELLQPNRENETNVVANQFSSVLDYLHGVNGLENVTRVDTGLPHEPDAHPDTLLLDLAVAAADAWQAAHSRRSSRTSAATASVSTSSTLDSPDSDAVADSDRHDQQSVSLSVLPDESVEVAAESVGGESHGMRRDRHDVLIPRNFWLD